MTHLPAANCLSCQTRLWLLHFMTQLSKATTTGRLNLFKLHYTKWRQRKFRGLFKIPHKPSWEQIYNKKNCGPRWDAMPCPVNVVPLGINNIFLPRLGLLFFFFFYPFLFVGRVRVWQNILAQNRGLCRRQKPQTPNNHRGWGHFGRWQGPQTESIFSTPNGDSISAHLEHHYDTSLGEFRCS